METALATKEANKLIKKKIGNAAVESFGISHQVMFLEFRDDFREDHILSIETDMESNFEFDAKSDLTEIDKALILFNRVNLCNVVNINCDDRANLVVEFDNGIRLHFSGSPRDKFSEPWQLASRESLDAGGYMIISTNSGGYAIWDNSVSAQ